MVVLTTSFTTTYSSLIFVGKGDIVVKKDQTCSVRAEQIKLVVIEFMDFNGVHKNSELILR